MEWSKLSTELRLIEKTRNFAKKTKITVLREVLNVMVEYPLTIVLCHMLELHSLIDPFFLCLFLCLNVN